jgi:hypothetical protein
MGRQGLGEQARRPAKATKNRYRFSRKKHPVTEDLLQAQVFFPRKFFCVADIEIGIINKQVKTISIW